jgi:hypothetical protein
MRNSLSQQKLEIYNNRRIIQSSLVKLATIFYEIVYLRGEKEVCSHVNLLFKLYFDNNCQRIVTCIDDVI